MVPPFDIFQLKANDELLWRGTAVTVEDAHARVAELVKSSPGDYLIVSLHTGNKTIIKSDGAGRAAATESSPSL
jgi:hypothetical protein